MGGWKTKRRSTKHQRNAVSLQPADVMDFKYCEFDHVPDVNDSLGEHKQHTENVESQQPHYQSTQKTLAGEQKTVKDPGNKATDSKLSEQNENMPQQSTTTSTNNRPPQFICINCGASLCQLYKRYSNNCNAIKTVKCDECKKVADKYIEFEAVIVMVDAVLLSQQAFRHMLYNRNGKLHWKLSLILLLLESFALWRKKRVAFSEAAQYELVHEKGFYICCLQNIIDNMIIIGLLLLVALLQRDATLLSTGGPAYTLTLLKAITLANFSKFFILPILVWRDNTTATAASIHHFLVLAHHLCALVYIYAVIGRGRRKLHATLIVLPVYLVKELSTQYISTMIESNF